jgi:hypothetical protein
MKYLAFLDIDGVFTSARVQYASANSRDMWNKFDPTAIEFMNKLHDKIADLHFVLISTWKEHLREDDEQTSHWIIAAFRNAGFRGEFASPWKTNPENFARFYEKDMTRANEIKEYLEVYAPNNQDYIIFDDNDYGFETVLGKNRWVHTDESNGILLKHMHNAMSIVGEWDKK